MYCGTSFLNIYCFLGSAGDLSLMVVTPPDVGRLCLLSTSFLHGVESECCPQRVAPLCLTLMFEIPIL